MMDGAAGPAGSFLGVERSLTGRRWEARAGDERTALALAQRFGLPELIGAVMAGRGIGPDEAERFLNPTLRDHLTDPAHLRDMDPAVDRSEERRVGKEGVSTCRTRWVPGH